ncbi:MAG: Ig-like domain repeat protein [Methanosphaera sp.]|nr:Ig-like domain repeat protein [Methanosphaera sp.]
MRMNKKYLFFILVMITLLLATTIVTANESINTTQEDSYQSSHITGKENNKVQKTNTQEIRKDITGINSTTKTADSTLEDTRTQPIIRTDKIPSTYVGEYITFNGTIRSEKSLDGSTIFLTDGNVLLNTTINLDTYSLKYKVPSKGSHTFNIYYEGNDEFMPVSTSITFRAIQRIPMLSYNEVKTEYVGTHINIGGKLSYRESMLENMKIEIHLNDEIHEVTTNKLGLYSYTFIPEEEKSYKVDIYYYGTNVYKELEKHGQFNIIKKTTNLTMNVRAINYYGNITNITGKLVAAGEVQPNTKINLTINNKTIPLQTDQNGIYHYKYKITDDSDHILTVSYPGDNLRLASNTTKTFKVNKLKTVLFLEPIKNTEYNNTATIRGVLITGNNTIANAKIKITINNQTVTCTTNHNGRFNHEYKTTSIQQNNITAQYHGNYTYYPTNKTTTFNTTKKHSKIIIDYIPTKTYNDKIKITGKLVSSNNPISNAKINININNENTTTTTGNDGKYTLNYEVKTIGQNNITASYHGDEYITKSENKRIFKSNKNQLKIKLNPITRVHYSMNTSITGKVTDKKSTPLKHINLNIKINKKEYTVKSDDKGLFNLSIKTTQSGKNNLSISYPGNKNYQNYTLKTTFTASNMPTQLTLNKITPKKVGEKIIITGTLKNAYNQTIKKQPITLQINNKKITIKTNNKGIYKHTIKAETLGKNNITASFSKKHYSKNIQHRTFTVTKKTLKIKLNPITRVHYSMNTSITGKVTDNNNKTIKNLKFKITVDKKQYTIKTDHKGLFNLSIKTTKSGKNKLLINYQGNKYYQDYTLKTTFTTSSMPTRLTLNKITPKKAEEKVVIKGILKDGNNKALKNKQITLELNGEKIPLKTNKKGEYKYTFNAEVQGRNNVTVSFSQKHYSKNSQHRTFIVQNIN